MPAPTPPRPSQAAPAEGPTGAGRQLQQLIVTICALYGRGDGAAIPTAALIKLLATLDVDAAAARSALSRLKKRGILLSDKRNGLAAYRLDPRLEDVFAEGDERIFAPRRARPGDRWLLAAFSVPESQRHLRHQIRRLLAGRGFGTVGPGLWIAPDFVYGHLRRELEREGLAEFVEFFAADVMGHDPATRVADWWDLDALADLYAGFVAAFEPVRRRWVEADEGSERGEADDTEDPRAFADYVMLLTAWRRLPYLDPGLPTEYLPDDWQGIAAERLFLGLHARLAGPAARHAKRVIGP